MRRLVLASRNKGKIQELKELLSDLPVEIVGVDAYPDLAEVEETGSSFRENAELKAKTVALATGELTLADDSGLSVDVLGGEPGVYSARYGQPGWTDRDRYEYLLEKVKRFPFEKRTARFVSAIALYDPATSTMETVEGSVEGLIADEPTGNNGFGYDPLFFLPEYNQTMAEIPETEKNRISHRARAMQQIKPILRRVLSR